MLILIICKSYLYFGPEPRWRIYIKARLGDNDLNCKLRSIDYMFYIDTILHTNYAILLITIHALTKTNYENSVLDSKASST